ncbi:MAG TPA: tRNA (guanosine(46)-N7)-methyltransferase TrmB [Bacteroidales bacterium]|nr:tRNA (guanosine(46)-N7)-methyltransferase TrmB [Bacteroidales bacterium]
MSSKNKLQRFAENETFPNLFQSGYEQLQHEPFPLKGRWSPDFFKNDNPIVVELGCGKGEYTIGLAQQYPERNFIGMDIKGARLWRGLKNSAEMQLGNVAFVRSRIELISHYFGEGEVSEVWITFPDPQPRKSRRLKRLTSPRFLTLYHGFLKPDGLIHLKTDSQLLYDYTLEVIAEGQHKLHYATDDLYATHEDMDVKRIRTFYEQIWLSQGLRIKYLVFSLNHENK